MIREFNITVLGPPRAGKTSLLTSIYSQFSQVVGRSSDLEITPVTEKDYLLEKHLAELRSAFSTSTIMPFKNADVVEPTCFDGDKVEVTRGDNRLETKPKVKKPANLVWLSNIRDQEYRFNLGQKNKKPKVQLVLRDYPGEQLLDNPKEVVQRVKDCAVTMIAIDTPALMADEGRVNPLLTHKNRNFPEKGKKGGVGIVDIFAEAFKDLKEKKLVLLVPVKCEKWMSNPATANLLLERLKMGYEQLLELLASDDLRDNVAVVVTPVETMGGIVYAYMDSKETYSPQFMKESIAAEFRPRYSDQPLRYILRFTLKRFLERKGFWFDLFGNDKPFIQAIDEFAKGCKSDSGLGEKASGFTIIQGKDLL
jgi:hypothetical protein